MADLRNGTLSDSFQSPEIANAEERTSISNLPLDPTDRPRVQLSTDNQETAKIETASSSPTGSRIPGLDGDSGFRKRRTKPLAHTKTTDSGDDWVFIPDNVAIPEFGIYGQVGEQRSSIHRHKVHTSRRDKSPAELEDLKEPNIVHDLTQIDLDSVSGGAGTVLPQLDDKEFEDVVSHMGLGGWHDWELEDIEQSQLRRGVWRELLGMDDSLDLQQDAPEGPPAEPLYPQGAIVKAECYVCFEETMLRRRLCCDFPVCDSCLESYLTMQVVHANVNIECLNPSCNSYIQRSEISARLPDKMKVKFYKFLIDANIDPTVKTCPRCSSGFQVEKCTLRKRKVQKHGLPVTCKRCGLDWCFTCHAPWHKGLTCRDYRKGNALLRDWAREFHYGQLNAQKCPKCKIFIQRSLGCDHMTCSRCDTSFCYRCGESYRSFKFLGNHCSRYSPFGCRYNFLPESPHMRRLIRGAVLGGKLIGVLALSGIGVAAGAVLLGVGIFVLPVWGGVKYHRRRKHRQFLRAHYKNNARKMQLNATEVVVRGVDSANSTLEDDNSSEENQATFSIGLHLRNRQCVEVMVHGNFHSPNPNDAEEVGRDGERKEVVADSTVIVTDVQEVKNPNGYITVIANISATVREEGDCGNDVQEVKNLNGCTTVASNISAVGEKEEGGSGTGAVVTDVQEMKNQNGCTTVASSISAVGEKEEGGSGTGAVVTDVQEVKNLNGCTLVAANISAVGEKEEGGSGTGAVVTNVQELKNLNGYTTVASNISAVGEKEEGGSGTGAVVTDVQEMKNQNGCTTVAANISAVGEKEEGNSVTGGVVTDVQELKNPNGCTLVAANISAVREKEKGDSGQSAFVTDDKTKGGIVFVTDGGEDGIISACASGTDAGVSEAKEACACGKNVGVSVEGQAKESGACGKNVSVTFEGQMKESRACGKNVSVTLEGQTKESRACGTYAGVPVEAQAKESETAETKTVTSQVVEILDSSQALNAAGQTSLCEGDLPEQNKSCTSTKYETREDDRPEKNKPNAGTDDMRNQKISSSTKSGLSEHETITAVANENISSTTTDLSECETVPAVAESSEELNNDFNRLEETERACSVTGNIGNMTHSTSEVENGTFKVSEAGNDLPKVSESENDSRKVSDSENDSHKVSDSENDSHKVSDSENDSHKVSESENDSHKVGDSENDSHKVSVSENDPHKVSESETDPLKVSDSENSRQNSEEEDEISLCNTPKLDDITEGESVNKIPLNSVPDVQTTTLNLVPVQNITLNLVPGVQNISQNSLSELSEPKNIESEKGGLVPQFRKVDAAGDSGVISQTTACHNLADKGNMADSGNMADTRNVCRNTIMADSGDSVNKTLSEINSAVESQVPSQIPLPSNQAPSESQKNLLQSEVGCVVEERREVLQKQDIRRQDKEKYSDKEKQDIHKLDKEKYSDKEKQGILELDKEKYSDKEKQDLRKQDKDSDKEKQDAPKQDKVKLSDKEKQDFHKDKISDNKDKQKEQLPSDSKQPREKDADSVTGDTNTGCFGNIFSKKISVNIQIPCRRHTTTAQSETYKLRPENQKPLQSDSLLKPSLGFCRVKSATWEKRGTKSGKPKRHSDVREVLPIDKPSAHEKTDKETAFSGQAKKGKEAASSEGSVKNQAAFSGQNKQGKDAGPLEGNNAAGLRQREDAPWLVQSKPKTEPGSVFHKGVLLRDCVVLDAPGCPKSGRWGRGDSVSLASTLSIEDVSDEERGGVEEGGMGGGREVVVEMEGISASEGFRGSTLSCDIVTYL